jgi:TRAP-type C4-dicarboxylate transport system permease small subunit
MTKHPVLNTVLNTYTLILRWIVFGFGAISALAVLLMMSITVADVTFGLFGKSIIGAYDIVKVSSAVAIAGALPYTTAVKGHVAIEYFHQKFSRKGRLFLDIFIRLILIVMFLFGVLQCVEFGNSLRRAGQVTQTLEIPVFWLPYMFAIIFFDVILVVLHNLLHPGREMIKP